MRLICYYPRSLVIDLKDFNVNLDQCNQKFRAYQTH